MAASGGITTLEKEISNSEISTQLDRVLSNRLFANSQRYPAFLRHVVEASLRGESSSLRERLIGVTVFHRATDYDTNADPIVRITAAEVRKRLAQYYHEPGHTNELRIELRNGSYVPEFYSAASVRGAEPAAPLVEVPPRIEEPPATPHLDASFENADRLRGLSVRVIVVALVTAVLVAGTVAGWVYKNRSKPLRFMDQVWSPLLEAKSPALICFGVPVTAITQPTPQAPLLVEWVTKLHTVSFDDVVAQDRITRNLMKNGLEYTLGNSDQTDFSTLRNHPVVLIGLLDNRWSIRASEQLRYRIIGESGRPSMVRIVDSRNPAVPWLTLDAGVQLKNFVRDYAIVARFIDPESGQPTWLIGGVGGTGTLAASEFLTDEGQMRLLFTNAPHDWQDKNFEVVLQTDVISGVAAKPKVLATVFW